MTNSEAFNFLKIVLGAATIFTGFLLAVLVIPLWLGNVKMNAMYDTRIPAAFKSDEHWYKINKYSAKVLIYCYSLPNMVFGVVLIVVPITSVAILAGLFLVSHSLMIIPITLTIRYGNRL